MTQSVLHRPAQTSGSAVEAVMTCDVPRVAGPAPVRRTAVEQPCRPTGRRLERRRGTARTARMSPDRGTRGGGMDVRSADSNTAPPVRAAVGRPVRPSAQIVRRRRWAAGLLAGVVLAGLVWVLALVGGQAQEAATGTPSVTEVVHVRSGESLTALARRIAPDLPPSGVIDVVRELNDLSSAGLRPGQALVVPRYR